jgi:hypothetical protein
MDIEITPTTFESVRLRLVVAHSAALPSCVDDGSDEGSDEESDEESEANCCT